MRVRSALQINLHPLDVRHAVHTLPHQLEVWGGQVDRVLLTVDIRRSNSGRYAGDRYDESRVALFRHLEAIARNQPNVELIEVDYSPATLGRLRDRWFAASTAYPEKAFDGGPFHAYFFGLAAARERYVVHMDSDMLFGGGSQTWLQEAIGWLERTPEALFVGPLPGPPRPDGSLVDRHGALAGMRDISPPERLGAEYPAYRFSSVSTRIFVVDQSRVDGLAAPMMLVRPDLPRRLRARLFRQSPLSAPAEEVLTAAMVRKGLCRIDFLGTGAGMYSLHPPYRSERFYRELPGLIARIVAGEIPEAQRGDYDINASMLDWSEARRDKTKIRRLLRAARSLVHA